MMALLDDARAALAETLSPPFRITALKILSVTAALLLVCGLALHHWLSGLVQSPDHPWFVTLLSVVEGLGLLFASIFLVAPASALVAGFFVDDLAARVERDLGGPEGSPLAIGRALWLSIRFAALSVLVLIVAIVLLFVPGLNAVAFLAANAYLSGRQYFEFAGLRFRPEAEVSALRRANGGAIYGAGLLIALFLAVPIVNLLAPLFGTALMVRVYRRISAGTTAIARPV